MKLDKSNIMRSSRVFGSEPFKENRQAEEFRPLISHAVAQYLEPEKPRSSATQPIFTLGRRSKGKALEI